MGSLTQYIVPSILARLAPGRPDINGGAIICADARKIRMVVDDRIYSYQIMDEITAAEAVTNILAIVSPRFHRYAELQISGRILFTASPKFNGPYCAMYTTTASDDLSIGNYVKTLFGFGVQAQHQTDLEYIYQRRAAIKN